MRSTHGILVTHMRAALCILLIAGCSRTGMVSSPATGLADAAAGDDAAAPPSADDAGAPGCAPEQERCDGLDNDCNGQIDDGLAPEPCDDGGFQFCVGGALSACPRVCAVCRPESERVCFPAYCSRWGTQTCDGDGLAWGPCRESPTPAECQGADDTWDAADDSPDTESCCVTRGDCCQDHWDLDADGDTGESVGACDDVSCDG